MNPSGDGEPMRVVHVTSYYGGDGAAIAVLRLHEGLRRLGADSRLFIGESRGATPDTRFETFMPPRDLRARLRRRIRRERIARSLASYRRPEGYETFSDDRSIHGRDFVSQIPACDIVHLHAMLNFVDYQAFFHTVPRRVPVVRTLHDMSFFTGGCHYDFGCGRYTARCGACPQLGSRHDSDLSRRIWERKHEALRAVPSGRLHVVAPSDWLAGEARRSLLLRDVPIAVIPHGLDTDVFAPRDKDGARAMLAIPPDARVVLFVAEPLTRRLKGFSVLAQALHVCADVPGLMLCSVGSGRPPARVDVPHIRLGHVGDARLLSMIYSAADLFVIPSLQEAFGQTALEAMACGTPVVGFAVGGIVDIVRPGVTGTLVPPGDTAALGASISDLLRQPERLAEMSRNARQIAVDRYRGDLPPRRYLDLYRSILGELPAAAVSASAVGCGQ